MQAFVLEPRPRTPALAFPCRDEPEQLLVCSIVVRMPCGALAISSSVAFFKNFADGIVESAIGTI